MFKRKKGWYPPVSRRKLKKRWLFGIVGLVLFCMILIFYWNLRPYVMAYARMNADSLMSTIANEALRKSLADYEVNSEELLHYYYDEKGNITACGVDTLEISRLSVKVLAAMDEYFQDHNALEFNVPVGAALGDSVFMGWWPDIPFKVRLIGNADIDYDRAFESVGINQVNQRVWLNLNFVIQVSAPLMNEVLSSSRKFVLVDRTFSGDVPIVFME